MYDINLKGHQIYRILVKVGNNFTAGFCQNPANFPSLMARQFMISQKPNLIIEILIIY